MSKSVSILSALAIVCSMFFFGSVYAQENVYKIGDKGPAGGIVFYDKGFTSNGWRYLEAAPEDQSSGCEWGPQGVGIPGDQGSAVGTGYGNTMDIVRACGKTDSAAQIASMYRGGGKSDWFLPSKDELKALYDNLLKNGIGGFSHYGYWSSTEEDASHAWYHGFLTGNQKKFNKYNSSRIRAIRMF